MDNIELLQERLTLLTQLPIVDFIPFLNYRLEPEFSTPLHFKRYARAFWSRESFKQSGGFALSPAQPSGVMGQGALL